MKKIGSFMLVMCLVLTGCGSEKRAQQSEDSKKETEIIEEQNSNANKEMLTEQREKNKTEIINAIEDIVTVQLPQNIIKAGGTEIPDLSISFEKADDNFLNISYDTEAGTRLDFTYDLSSKEFEMLSLTAASDDIESYTILLASVLYLSEFGFTEQEIKDIASMITNKTYELQVQGYKISQVDFPLAMFMIKKI